MNLMKKMMPVVFALMGYLVPVQAALVYDESVNGDLSATPATLITLSLGANTIRGSSLFAGGQRDLDSFLFQLAPGLIATNGIYEVLSRSIAGNTTQISSHYDLYDSTVTLLGNYNADILDNGNQTVFGTVLTSGTYGVNNASMSRNGAGGTWDYEITINVEVPEPESLALAGLGLLALTASRLRRRMNA